MRLAVAEFRSSSSTIGTFTTKTSKKNVLALQGSLFLAFTGLSKKQIGKFRELSGGETSIVDPAHEGMVYTFRSGMDVTGRGLSHESLSVASTRPISIR